jgi:hypothetical protein
MTIRSNVLVGLALSLLGVVTVSPASAQSGSSQRTILTFSQPVEVPGHVLPAGTYTFRLLDSMSDRHIVRISNEDGTRHIGLVMAIPNYRLEATDKTVITFNEVAAGAPNAIRAWFYPGRTIGQEFVYPKRRALELAVAARVPVPAIDDEIPESGLKTVAIVAVTPDRKEVPVADVIQTRPMAGQTAMASASTRQGRLPKTAGQLPLLVVIALGSLGLAAAMLFGRPLVRRLAPAYIR